MILSGKKIAVLGVGEAGRAAARWLNAHGVSVICCDMLGLDEWPDDFLSWCEQKGVEVCTEEALSDADVAACDLAVASPGIPPKGKAVSRFRENGVAVIGELALAISFWKGRLVGITGTNGKTTTTALTSHILNRASVPNVRAGNISPPLFDLMGRGDSEDRTAVLEVSSFQLEYFPDPWPKWLKRPRFAAAVFLNLAPDHLDRHGSVDEYGRCKARMFYFQEKDDLAVLGPGLDGVIAGAVAEPFFLSPAKEGESGAFWDMKRDILELRRCGRLSETYDVSGWKLMGRHNMENLAAAAASARAAGAAPDAVQAGLETFQAPPYRLQKSRRQNGITFINDSKATNAAALIAALGALEGDIILIAGGRSKGEDFIQLADFLKRRNGRGRVTDAVLIGEEADELRRVLRPFVNTCQIAAGSDGIETMERAVKLAVSLGRPGSTVLLSPACASFDMFSSYKERGEIFDRVVRGLK